MSKKQNNSAKDFGGQLQTLNEEEMGEVSGGWSTGTEVPVWPTWAGEVVQEGNVTYYSVSANDGEENHMGFVWCTTPDGTGGRKSTIMAVIADR